MDWAVRPSVRLSVRPSARPRAAVPERAGGARPRRAERGRPGGGAARARWVREGGGGLGVGARRGVAQGSRALGHRRGQSRVSVQRRPSGWGTCPARLVRSRLRLLGRGPPSPAAAARLSLTKEGKCGGRRRSAGAPGRRGWRPPPAPRKTPPRAQPRPRPEPRSQASAARRPRPARRRRSRTRRRLPRAARPRPPLSPLRCAGPVSRSCRGPTPPRCATSLNRSRPRRSAR